jgi:hypothetical protein
VADEGTDEVGDEPDGGGCAKRLEPQADEDAGGAGDLLPAD